MTDMPVREIALDALMEILEEGRFCHIVIGRTLDKYAYLDRQDRAFLKRLVEGTVEYRLQEDYVLGQYSRTKPEKMKPLIRTLLRMSVYQIFHMDRVPDSAACNEAVKLAKKRGFQGLSGFVNGVLRSIVRNKENMTWPSDEVRYSVPGWIIAGWERQFGREVCLKMLEACNSESRLVIRMNTGLASPESIRESLEADGAEVFPLCEDGSVCALSWRESPEMLRAFREGLVMVQDLSSSLAGDAAGIREGNLVLDICGAPGGKALHAADILKGSGQVIVRDLTEEKAERIRENIERSGYRNIEAQVWDARIPDPQLKGRCDVVIADLPCSGLGVMGRKPDIRWNASQKGIVDLAALQRQILTAAAEYVKPGGTLVYSTCTITEEENTGNFRWFADMSGFVPVDFTERFPKELRKETMKDGYVQLLPGIDPCDGFFISVLRRN